MAKRRMSMGYGSDPIPQSNAGASALPPPPDGKPPVRLPFVEQPPEQPVVDEQSQDPNIDIMRLLQSLGRV